MISSIQRLGRVGMRVITKIGAAVFFLFRTVWRMPRFRSLPLLIEQLFALGMLSLVIILVSAFFVGMVLALQGYNTLDKFGATSHLGQLLALSVTRELGPVLAALLFAGRAGSALAAEVGLMKTTEQLAALKMLGVDPLWRIISPRLWGSIFAVPILTAIFSAAAICGGYWVSVVWLGVDDGQFWGNMRESVNFHIDVQTSFLKSIIFGFVVGWIALFQGYDCQPNAAGMARATTKTVVYSSLAVLGLDFILTAMMIGDW